MADLDLSKMFDSMSMDIGDSGNPIQTIYDIIPTFDGEQQKLLFELQYFITKWDLMSLDELINRFTALISKNKNLSFFGSRNLSQMLSAYTQADLIKGISIRPSTERTDS